MQYSVDPLVPYAGRSSSVLPASGAASFFVADDIWAARSISKVSKEIVRLNHRVRELAAQLNALGEAVHACRARHVGRSPRSAIPVARWQQIAACLNCIGLTLVH
ncbi:hypothetical protein [Cupriavidus sp. CuC1]|uniref:hypothetical protein n=1 Tax=Cupriavidus sp. CuC1 TaxID=3373131 RepID=UPI0037D15879